MEKTMKKSFRVCCGIVLLLISVMLPNCSSSSGSDSQDFSTTVVGQTAAQQQPYETIKNNPSHYYVSQESGLCGATSFYMAMKYYGDHLKNIKTGIVDEDCPAEITDKIDYPTELSATSQIAVYIQYIDDTLNSLAGIHLSSLVKAAEGLLEESGNNPLYSTVMAGNYGDDLTGAEDGISDQKRIFFLIALLRF